MRLKSSIGAILDNKVYGGTPTHYGLLEAHAMIRKRPEPVKVIFLLTDGEAGDPEAAHAAAETILRAKIHLIGMGIGPDATPMKIPGWVSVPDVAALPSALTTAVNSTLTAIRQHQP